MEGVRGIIPIILGSVIAVVLQIVVAPYIAIAAGMPNFLMAFALAVAVIDPRGEGPVLPFVMGLLYDLFGLGPVGAMALLLVLASYTCAHGMIRMDNDTKFMPIALICISSIAVEIVYAIIMLATGVSAGFLEAFVYRALPCLLYDCIVGIVAYFACSKFLAPSEKVSYGGSVGNLR